MPTVCEVCKHTRMVHAVLVDGKIILMCDECKRAYEKARKDK